MKKILLPLLIVAGITATAQVKIGTNPTILNLSAVLELESTTRGLLLPRMSSTQRLAIANPAAGLQVYDTSTNTAWFFNGTIWVNAMATVASSTWDNNTAAARISLTNLSNGTTARPSGTEFVVGDNGNVGVGTASPTSKLQIVGLPRHVDNAAALLAGLTIGALFHAGDGIIRVVF